MSRFSTIVCAVLLATATPLAQAQMYACSLDGALVYRNKPCNDVPNKSATGADKDLAATAKQAVEAGALAPNVEIRIEQEVVTKAEAPAQCDAQALIQAAQNADLGALEICYKQGVDLNARDSRKQFRGRTALHWASVNGSTKTVAWLLNRGADPAIRAAKDYGATPLHLAASQGSTALTTLLNQPGQINLTDYRGRTALHVAAGRGNLAGVLTLLSENISIDQPDRIGKTALMLAAQHGHLEIVRHLLDLGADIQAETKTGLTALHYATGGPLAMVDLLLDAGAITEHADQHGQTPLLWALNQRVAPPFPILQRLIEAGADLHRRNEQGHTGMELAERRLKPQQLTRLTSIQD